MGMRPALFQLVVETPDGADFDIALSQHSGKDFADMGGEPGWLLAKNDFKPLPPGSHMLLPVYGTPRYFARHPQSGVFRLRAVYQNLHDGKAFGLKGV